MDNKPQKAERQASLQNRRSISEEVIRAENAIKLIDLPLISPFKMPDGEVVDIEFLEIKSSLGRCVSLLGIPESKVPSGDEKKFMIQFLIKVFPDLTLLELEAAFMYAIEGRLEVNMGLYGNIFSANYVSEVVRKYRKLKKKLNQPEIEHLTNSQRVAGFLDKLSPETLDHIKQIGKTDKKKRLGYEYYKEQAKNDPFQEYLREFDALHFESGITTNGFRFIIYGGSEMSPDNYCDYRAREVIFMSYEYLRSLKLDQTEFEKQVFFG